MLRSAFRPIRKGTEATTTLLPKRNPSFPEVKVSRTGGNVFAASAPGTEGAKMRVKSEAIVGRTACSSLAASASEARILVEGRPDTWVSSLEKYFEGGGDEDSWPELREKDSNRAVNSSTPEGCGGEAGFWELNSTAAEGCDCGAAESGSIAAG